MPPKKRPRLEPSGTSTPQPEATQPSAISTPSLPQIPIVSAEEDLLKDPWTAKQEITLFKALIRYKPTGIHKHFNMLSIARQFEPLDNIHTRIPGIWSKLATLYDLDALDEREENYAKAIARGASSSDDENTGEESIREEVGIEEFSMMADPDLYDLMLNRKLASDGGSSPLTMPYLLDRDRASEISASPAPSRRAGRGGARSSIVGSASRQSQMSKAGTRRSSGVGISEISPDEANDEDGDEDGTEHGEDISQVGSSPPTRATRSTGRAVSGKGSKKKQ